MSFGVAVDVGGTFTDVTISDLSSSEFWVVKTPTTPDGPVQGLMDGLRRSLELSSSTVDELRAVLHATTIATNQILEGNGAPTGLVTTRGFRYVLEIGRHDAPRDRNIHAWVKEARPVPPELIREVTERIGVDGAVLRPLDESDCRAAALHFREQGVRSIAVCFLASYANPVHEQAARDLILEIIPDADVSLSSEVLPVLREYERSMATVLNAYVAPAVARHVAAVRAALNRDGFTGPLYVMKSNGGVVRSESVVTQPITTALSGPAAGVVGASIVGRSAGEANLVTIDVGGTSADLCLVRGGAALVATGGRVGSWPFALPMVDITTIGAGGGSIAAVESTSLQVGPQSAGAVPGPACYGAGGTRPTVTDAHLVLGRLPSSLIDGGLRLDAELAARAVHDHVARPLGLSLTDAASGILAIADNHMVGAVRVLTVERGFDPGEASLLAFGGAGPLHAASMARSLGVRSTIIPRNPGVLSALGLLGSSIRNDFVRACYVQQVETRGELVMQHLAGLDIQARDWLDREQIDEAASDRQWFGDVRYENQRHELSIPITPAATAQDVATKLVADFHATHQQLYGYASDVAEVELVSLHVVATGTLSHLELPKLEAATQDAEPRESRAVHFSEVGGWVDCPIFDRAALLAGHVVTGPAVVEQLDTTVVIAPGQRATCDEFGNLVGEGVSAVSTDVDVVRTELVRGALRSAQTEIETMIERTAMSPYISEKRDYVVMFCDGEGRPVTLPNHTGANMLDVVLEHFPRDTMRSGDMYWYNDCYASTGAVSHLPDMVFVCPVFVAERLIAFSLVYGHFWDIGGMRPGSLPPDATEVYQEGIIIPPVRIFHDGVWNADVVRIFLRNSRFSDMMRGDIQALTAAARTGERRLAELAERHGVDALAASFESMFARTRASLREAMLERIPEGSYSFGDTVDGVSEGGSWVRMTLTRCGDEFRLDTTDSDDQVPGPFNYIMHESVPSLMMAFQLLGGDAPLLLNDGATRIIDEVAVRPGSILRPMFPAPLGSRSHTMLRANAVIQGLLACALEGEAPAASSTYGICTLRYFDSERNRWVMFTDGLAVGHGGRPTADGHDAVYFIGQHNFPVEYIEERYPIRMEEYAVQPDSGGPGRHRGGVGVIRQFVFVGERAMIATRFDNVRFPSWGVNGGRAGMPGCLTLNPGGPDERSVPPIADGIELQHGDRVRLVTSGGGGWGHPYDRSVDVVLNDVRNGFVTTNGARRDYGVVVSPTFEVDRAATADLRAARPPHRMFHRFGYVDNLWNPAETR